MQNIEALILLRNFIERLEPNDDGKRSLSGSITDRELQAINIAISVLENAQSSTISTNKTEPLDRNLQELGSPDVFISPKDDTHVSKSTSDVPAGKLAEQEDAYTFSKQLSLNLASTGSDGIPDNMRLCMDFGTAMSKATLVNDGGEFEEIHVLRLGIPGDNEEDSQTMLISSVYIASNGRLWFGKKAVDYSTQEGEDRDRMDNIKRWLSEDQMSIEVDEKFNPTEITIQYADVILAYLTFFTWTVNKALILDMPDLELSASKLIRRFAMPCLPDPQAGEVSLKIRRYLSEAQILADTFADAIHEGLPLKDFVSCVKELRTLKRDCKFVAEDITEPLGVAGSLISWKTNIDLCAMVIDVGAGTSDFSMFQIHIDPDLPQKTSAVEIFGASRGIRLAGNYLDSALKHMALARAGVNSNHPQWSQINWGIDRLVRQHKETLFSEGEVFITLSNGEEVHILLKDFLEIEPVKQFGDQLKDTMRQMLNDVDESWINRIHAHPTRYVTVVLTGGGASLPMVQSLATESVTVRNKVVPLRAALSFPMWMSTDYPELEEDYPRIAVSLGGARRRLLARSGPATITAGDISAPAKLGGYYMKGI